MNELPAEGDGGDVLFRWGGGNAKEVSVLGSWSRWRDKLVLNVEDDVFRRGKLFSGTYRVPFGRHLFFFLVDGKKMHDAQLRSVWDEEGKEGRLCNVVNVYTDNPLRLQLPEKDGPKESPEERDFINTLREFELRTPTTERKVVNAREGKRGCAKAELDEGALAPQAMEAAIVGGVESGPEIGAGLGMGMKMT
ncbi:unnamed protein product, partial [Choristocarpus tenellus]